MMVIERIMMDETYYDLFQYGIEGVNYIVEDGYLDRPESYVSETDYYGMSAWALNNDEFMLRQRSEHPIRYELNAKWSQNHISNPYDGFSFDPDNVSAELSAIANVNSQLGVQLLLGKTDNVAEALEEYREQLKDAGIDDVLEELKAQLEEFDASR